MLLLTRVTLDVMFTTSSPGIKEIKKHLGFWSIYLR